MNRLSLWIVLFGLGCMTPKAEPGATDADAEDEPSLGQMIQSRGLLRDRAGMA